MSHEKANTTQIFSQFSDSNVTQNFTINKQPSTKKEKKKKIEIIHHVEPPPSAIKESFSKYFICDNALSNDVPSIYLSTKKLKQVSTPNKVFFLFFFFYTKNYQITIIQHSSMVKTYNDPIFKSILNKYHIHLSEVMLKQLYFDLSKIFSQNEFINNSGFGSDFLTPFTKIAEKKNADSPKDFITPPPACFKNEKKPSSPLFEQDLFSIGFDELKTLANNAAEQVDLGANEDSDLKNEKILLFDKENTNDLGGEADRKIWTQLEYGTPPDTSSSQPKSPAKKKMKLHT